MKQLIPADDYGVFVDNHDTESVIGKVSDWLVHNGYPTQITTPDKVYQTRYR